MRSGVSQFLSRVHVPSAGGYRFSERGSVTLLSTSFAVRTRYLLQAWDGVDRDGLRQRLQTSQTEDGHFTDPAFRLEDTRGSHSAEYVRWQSTFFALSALDMLGGAPPYQLAFIEPLLDPTRLRQWLHELDWTNFWYGSNQVMFLLYCLAYLDARQAHRPARAAAERCLDLLDAQQDAHTGYWGRDAQRTAHRRMYAAAHIYMFHDYYRRTIQHAERIIESTLALQHRRGLYGSRHGGACEDCDGVEVLLRASAQTPHRRQQVCTSLDRTAHAIQLRQDPNGGFSYRLAPGWRDPFGALSALLRRRQTYSYRGWQRMSCRVFEPDTWATYFRALTVAAVQRRLTGAPYQFYDLPAWGYGGRTATE